MSFHYSRALVAAYSEASSADGEPSAPSKSIPTAALYCASDKMTEYSRLSRSGMILEPLTESLGENVLTWFLAGSHVNHTATPENNCTKKTQETCGQKQHTLFQMSCQSMFCWKMCPEYYPTCQWSSETCEELAIPSKGPALLPPPPWVRDIYASGSGYAPTLTRRDRRTLLGSQPPKRAKTSGPPLVWAIAQKYLPTVTRKGKYNRKGASKNSGNGLATVVGGRLNPTWTEWYMGFPLGWTALEPLEMRKFQQWLDSHGKH